MWPYLFEISGLKIYNYGLVHLLAIAALAAFGGWWLRRKGAEPSVAIDATVAYTLSMFFFAHFAYYLVEEGFSKSAIVGMANITSGGLWGGLLFLIVGIAIYALARRFPLWTTMDLLAPPVLLSLAIGKVACLLNGCCWGGPSGGFFGLRLHPECHYSYPAGPLHPVPLYDALWAGASLAVLVALDRRKRRPGTVFLVFVVLYSAGRFVTEFLRYDYRGRTGVMGLYASQLVEVCSVAAAVCLLAWVHFFRRTTGPGAEGDNPEIGDAPFSGGAKPARLSRRAMAFCIDSIPSCVLIAAAVAIEEARGVLLAAACATYVIEFVLLTRTPGEFVFGLSLVDRKGRRAGMMRRLVRAACIPLPIASIAGMFRPLASRSRQAFHDMTAGVQVVAARRIEAGIEDRAIMDA